MLLAGHVFVRRDKHDASYQLLYGMQSPAAAGALPTGGASTGSAVDGHSSTAAAAAGPAPACPRSWGPAEPLPHMHPLSMLALTTRRAKFGVKALCHWCRSCRGAYSTRLVPVKAIWVA